MAHDQGGDAGSSEDLEEGSYPCPHCGVTQPQPRQQMFGGTFSGRHQCYCVWEDQPNGPMVLLATGLCCHRTGFPGIAEHHRSNRRWARLKSPRAVDWDEVASCVASTRRVDGDPWRQVGWPRPSVDHARLLSAEHRSAHWPPGASEAFFSGDHRKHMAATADEIADWLMLARDRIMHSSGSFLVGSADVHAAGELVARLGDALRSWDSWRASLVTDEAARARRILAAAAFTWGATSLMFRNFVADHLDAGLAQRLGEKEVAVLACSMHLRRRGRPRKHDDPAVGYTKQDFGLAADEVVPDKIEALQRLAATIGIPRISSDAVEDQVQPLLARMAEIRKWRQSAFADLQNEGFDTTEAAMAAFENADIEASVMEDEAVRTCGTRPRRKETSSASRKKAAKAAKGRNSRRGH